MFQKILKQGVVNPSHRVSPPLRDGDRSSVGQKKRREGREIIIKQKLDWMPSNISISKKLVQRSDRVKSVDMVRHKGGPACTPLFTFSS